MIEIHGNEVHIDVVIEDQVVATLLGAVELQHEREDLLADAVEIGARMVQRQHDGQAGDLIRREMSSLQDHLTTATEMLLSGAGSGFAEAMKPIMEQISGQLISINGRLDGVLAVSQARQEVESERERGTAKGRPFEEEVAAAVQSIANHNGDSCEHVGDVAGIGGRAGDVIVEIGGAEGPARGRVVFEAKTGRLTRPEALRELDRAREARDADYAVLVVEKPVKMPAGTREFHEYGGDKMMVVFDADPSSSAVGLEVGYALARARVLMSRSEIEGADVSAARAAVEQAEQHLERVRGIKSRMTSISRAVHQAGDEVDTMVNVVRSCLERATEALR